MLHKRWCGVGGGLARGAFFGLVCGWAVISAAADETPLASATQWPAATAQTRPWSRWWWLGSAVDRQNLTRLLETYQKAGIGGVEICPIYGAKGYEDRYIDFLSPQWMEMLAHTTTEAKRLGMGVDLTCGTGWPFGGPDVGIEQASSKVVLKTFDVAGPGPLAARLPEGRLQCLRAVSDAGRQVDLISQVKDGQVEWTPPPGKWRVYAVVQSGPVMKVKRAAPGGVGNVLDPFSVASLDQYLARFDRAFADYHAPMPRCFFHDSYEYYNASWTTDFFSEFQKRRGYDLREHLPAFFGEGTDDAVGRVQGDYRQTISELHLAYIERWTQWCHGHGSLSRNQAHGSPTNLLDTYAAADIPETEIFGSVDEKNVALNKFASSAAHVTGRTLSSSESFTWLTDHFQASLSDVKQAADFLFLSGVNHIFFHGIPYSPAEAKWPGWQFYAAVNFGPQGGLWHDLPEFNAYVSRCESVLQSGTSANDILLYVPQEDFWNAPGKLIIQNPIPPSFADLALTLWEKGYAYDAVSDQFLDRAQSKGGRVVLGGNGYRVIVVPTCRRMSEKTLQRLLDLANGGATVIVEGQLPGDVPGLANLDERRATLKAIRDKFLRPGIGEGKLFLGADVGRLLEEAHVPREQGADLGLRFVRRTGPGGYQYLIANRSAKAINSWIELGVSARSAAILDPRSADRSGMAAVAQSDGATKVYLQLDPGESCILRTFSDSTPAGPRWTYFEPAGEQVAMAGSWNVQFVEGGPELPAALSTKELSSWTNFEDARLKGFSGTARYSIRFERPEVKADDWRLDLGRVGDSARATLNGHDVGPLWSAPFHADVGRWLQPGTNELQVEVTNLAINRIEEMDRQHENWKYFHDANLASKTAKVFDASKLPPRDSGLLGPVRLIPLKQIKFEEAAR